MPTRRLRTAGALDAAPERLQISPTLLGGDEEPCADVRFAGGESQRERGGEHDAWLDPKVQDHFRFGGHGEFQQAHHGDLLLPIVGRFKDWSIFPCRRSRS